MLYRVSQFSHQFRHPRRDIIALWHALSMELFFVDASAAEGLAACRHEPKKIEDIGLLFPGDTRARKRAVRSLVSSGILVPETVDESLAPLILAESLEKEKFIGVLYLMLHDGCNLRCTYCFENVREPAGFRPSSMTAETAEAGLDLFAKLYEKYSPPAGHEPKVQLYGGEPLLNPKVFMHAASYFRGLQREGRIEPRVGLATVTNGAYVTESMADFIVAHDISVGVSVDGPQDLHNRHRRGGHPKDSYLAAVKAFDLLRSKGAKVGISVTLTPEVVADFERVLDFLLNDLGVEKGLSFNILHHTKAIPLAQAYYNEAADCILRAFREFRGRGIWEDRAMRKATAFADRYPLHADCAAIGHQIVVSPDGKIGICQDFIKERLGFGHSVHDMAFDPFDDREFVEWSTRSPLRMEACHSCPALTICGGGCPASIETEAGSMWEVDRRICPHSLKTLEFLIWDSFESTDYMN